MNPFRVFLHVRAVFARDRITRRGYCSEIRSRTTGTLLYTSRPRATEDEARALAAKYVAREPGRYVFS